MKFQLWSRDEYGSTAIISTFESAAAAAKKASLLVTEANFGNSLSSSEQMRTVEAYFVEFDGVNSKNYYAGTQQGKHSMFKQGETPKAIDPKLFPVNIYIGSRFTKALDKKPIESRIYMKTDKGEIITNLADRSLEGKTVYFIRPISS
jgi:hypothetical protein